MRLSFPQAEDVLHLRKKMYSPLRVMFFALLMLVCWMASNGGGVMAQGGDDTVTRGIDSATFRPHAADRLIELEAHRAI